MKLQHYAFIGILFLQLGCQGLKVKKGFPLIRQKTSMQCGPICLQMVAKYYGRDWEVKELERLSSMDSTGTSLFGLSEASDSIGLKNISVKLDFQTMVEEAPLPAIAHWMQRHFIVVYHATPNKVYVADPALGHVEYSKDEFCKYWIPADEQADERGILMLMEITNKFYEKKNTSLGGEFK